MLLYTILALLAILLIVNIFLTLKAGKKEESNELTEIKNSVATLISNLKDTERNLKDEFTTNRKESTENSKGLREEIGKQLNEFTKHFWNNSQPLLIQ